MLPDDHSRKTLINLTKYAKSMGITRQAVHYQLAKGICAVPHVVGTKPRKWYLEDVIAHKRLMGNVK